MSLGLTHDQLMEHIRVYVYAMNVTEVPTLRYLVIVQPYLCHCHKIISSHVGVLMMLEMIIGMVSYSMGANF